VFGFGKIFVRKIILLTRCVVESLQNDVVAHLPALNSSEVRPLGSERTESRRDSCPATITFNVNIFSNETKIIRNTEPISNHTTNSKFSLITIIFTVRNPDPENLRYHYPETAGTNRWTTLTNSAPPDQPWPTYLDRNFLQINILN
jgi:hypothetical protein